MTKSQDIASLKAMQNMREEQRLLAYARARAMVESREQRLKQLEAEVAESERIFEETASSPDLCLDSLRMASARLDAAAFEAMRGAATLEHAKAEETDCRREWQVDHSRTKQLAARHREAVRKETAKAEMRAEAEYMSFRAATRTGGR